MFQIVEITLSVQKIGYHECLFPFFKIFLHFGVRDIIRIPSCLTQKIFCFIYFLTIAVTSSRHEIQNDGTQEIRIYLKWALMIPNF